MVEERPAAAPKREYQTRIAILLAAAAVTTALVGARTANLAGSAGGEWESAVRVEVKRAAARTTAEIFVYGSTVLDVTSYQESLIRSQEYAAAFDSLDELVALTTPEFEALSILAQLHGEEARSLEEVVARDERYFVGGELGGGFDLQRKLADQRGEDLSAIEMPAAIRAEGDDLSKRGVAEALVGVLAAVAFLLGSVANALGRGRLLAWWAGAAVLAVAVGAAVVLEVAPVA